MIMIDKAIILASRASRLALVQTASVSALLLPSPSKVEAISTRGDEVIDRHLAAIGGKGLFVKALESSLLSGAADAAVHSAKDMDKTFAEGTFIAAYLPRVDRRDALVGGYASLAELPLGAVVGTSSPRRSAMLKSYRPDLQPRLLRGNLDRRLARLEAGDYDAIILAMAGLLRLDIDAPIHPIPEADMLPSAGQGVIAVQALLPSCERSSMVASALSPLNDKTTSDEVEAERAVLAHLDGDCYMSVGVSARALGDRIALSARLLSPDGAASFTASASGLRANRLTLGTAVAADLLTQAGGRDFLTAPPLLSGD